MTTRRFRTLTDRFQSATRRKPKSKTANRTALRRLVTQQLESRQLLAGPDLIAIRPDAGALLEDGDTLRNPPQTFNLLFAGGARLDEASITPQNVRLIRSGGDGDFDNGSVEVTIGYVGLERPGDTSDENRQRIVLRAASQSAFAAGDLALDGSEAAMPDDIYRIEITSGITGGGMAFDTSTGDAVTEFTLDRAPRVLAVVPQPVSQDGDGSLTQAADTVVVYFDKQQLDAASASDSRFYRLIDSADATQTPAAISSVVYNPEAATATITLAGAIPTGTYRLDIGGTNPTTGQFNFDAAAASDDNTTFDLATLIPTIGGADRSTIRLTGGAIERQGIALPPRVGGEDEPGHRTIQREEHIVASGTTATPPRAITVVPYHFPADFGRDSQNNLFTNSISETEKAIVREILDIYASVSGYEFVEDNRGGGRGLRIGKGDLAALNPRVASGVGDPLGLSGKVA